MSELRSGLTAPGDQLLAELGLAAPDLGELRRPPAAPAAPPPAAGAATEPTFPSAEETIGSPEIQAWLKETAGAPAAAPRSTVTPAPAGAPGGAAGPAAAVDYGMLGNVPVVGPVSQGVTPRYPFDWVDRQTQLGKVAGYENPVATTALEMRNQGLVLGSDNQIYRIRGGAHDPAVPAQQEAATTAARAGAAAPFETLTVPVLQPDGTVRDQTMTRDQFIARQRAQLAAGGAPGPSATAGPGAAPGGGPAPGAFVGAPVMTPEQHGVSEAYGEQAKAIMDAAAAAPKTLGNVQVLRAAAQQFNEGSFGGMGPSAADRLNMANRLVDLGNQLGFQVPDELKQTVAGGQIIGKTQGQMTAGIVRQLGSGEAQSIYNATQAYTPGVTMSKGGYDAIVNSIEQGATRDLDKAKFQEQWLASHPSLAGMSEAFNKANPIEIYSSKVAPIPTNQAKGNFVPGAIYVNPNGVRATRLPDGTFQPVQ